MSPSSRNSRSRSTATDDRLAYLDHAAFLSMRSSGLGQLMQIVWIYEHPVDLDAVERFHRYVGYGLLGRRIERSPLPFGRPRWVASLGPTTALDVAAGVRPRADIDAWADERALLPVDPELGPGWHMGMVSLDDGSTAFSLVASHCIADGVGALQTIADALKGEAQDLGYSPSASRPRVLAMVEDARQTVRCLPETGRALRKVAGLARQHRHDLAASAQSRAGVDVSHPDQRTVVPVVTTLIDIQDLEERAQSLGGTNYTLVVGIVAKVAERLGRHRDDGSVTVVIPITDRGEHDTRANAMPFATVQVDPTHIESDLAQLRCAVREAVRTVRDVPDETRELLPLVPFVPRRAMDRLAGAFLGSADLPVTCSHLGTIDPAVGRLDGTEAEYIVLRGLNQDVRRRDLERGGGQLFLICGGHAGKLAVAIGSYQSGGENTKEHLRGVVTAVLADFGITGWKPL